MDDNCNISDLDDDDQNYLPLLHYAVKCGNFDIVKTLLDHKRINVNVCDENGDLALRHAFAKKHNGINKAIIDLFLDKESIAINHQNNNKETLLHLAILSPYHYLIEDLAKRGVDVNLIDRQNNTALHFSVAHEFFGVTEKLLQIPNLKLDIKNIYGMTAYELAVRKGFDKIAELIQERQSVKSPNVSNWFGLF
ncbi:ankyrin repeat domain-containing protein [Sodalis sp. RH15]|uniref:ankyrin repeat domain-containing protein n=1 Tax=Sodalis sp. RH15 TaxID=3394330 RepID=UPI0039B6159D